MQQSVHSQSGMIGSNWQGSLQLVYAPEGETTQVIHSRSQAPLKLQRPFYPEGPAVCHSVILHTAGGVVGGDRLSLDVQLQPHTQALITTAAASKIYRTNGQEARQIVQASVSEGSCLEWFPQETIVFDQAIYHQEMRVDLAPGASWLGWEITRFGRTARGEKFVRGNWRSHTEIWQSARPLWIDRQWLAGDEATFHSPNGLAGFPIVGSFAYVGQSLEPGLLEQARALWTGSSGETGMTRLQAGLLCRYRGHSTSDVRHWFTQVWHLIRLSLLGRSACIPRVWGV
ncbi:MAG: urease accessory protein UreD [Kovacikia sp.]